MDIEMLQDLSEEEAIAKIFEECDDNETIYDLCCCELDFTLEDVMLYAVQNDKVSFVSDYVDELEEINDSDDGYCSYLYETDNETIIDIFKGCGAVYSDDDYYNYRFSYCTTTCEVCSFEIELQKEAIESYLDNTGMTAEEFCEFVENGGEADEDAMSVDIYDYEDVIDALGVVIKDGAVEFEDRTSYEDGSKIVDILTGLGYEVEFDGESWKFETNGYYYIE